MHTAILIPLTFAGAMLLEISRLPAGSLGWLAWCRPEWLCMVTFYWGFQSARGLNPIVLWCFGLFVDVLLGQPLGLNGAILALIAYVVGLNCERLRMYSMPQQVAILLMILLLAETLRSWILNLAGHSGWSFETYVASFITVLLWPVFEALVKKWHLPRSLG